MLHVSGAWVLSPGTALLGVRVGTLYRPALVGCHHLFVVTGPCASASGSEPVLYCPVEDNAVPWMWDSLAGGELHTDPEPLVGSQV